MTETKIPRGEFRNPSPNLTHPDAAKNAVDSLLSSVQEAHSRFGDPTSQDYRIASLPLEAIQDKLIYGEMRFKELIEARIRLTVKASLTTHCLTAFPWKQALERTEELQKAIDDGDNDDPRDIIMCDPLFGLVFSVKDCIHVEGLHTTLGVSSRAGQSEAASAEIVSKMTTMGAILIAKTTAPQLIMSNTTESPLWGTTRGPIQSAEGSGEEFQVGGSSGGDAALVKMGGSQIGIGTDMGGSIRQPASLNELVGFKYVSKPDCFRWSLPQDFMTGLPHTDIPATAPGLLSRDVLTIKRVVEAFDGIEPPREDEDAMYDEFEGDPYDEDEGNHPRLVVTKQKCSPAVAALIDTFLATVKGNRLMKPTRVDELGEIELAPWTESWMEYATQDGFDDARAMLADDPLIVRTLFDEARLNVTDADKKVWKADEKKLAALKARFMRQAGITEGGEEGETVIFVTPTYVLGGPAKQNAFISLDDKGFSEIWCEVFNLLDWPSVSVPFGKFVHEEVRQEMYEKAKADDEWKDVVTGRVKGDPIEGGGDRLPYLSLQLATLPGKHLELLDYARRLGAPLFE